MKLHEGVVRVLGGLQVLIEFNSKSHAEMALNEIIGRPNLFSKPEIWEGQPTHFERIAWLKVFGIPLCISENKVVNDVGSLFGEVVKSARVERVGLDASFQFIGVLIKHGNRIQDEVFLRWKGRTFKVWVMEDYNEWLEDFVLDPREEKNGCSGQRNEGDGMDDKSPEKQPECAPAPEAIVKEVFMEKINGANFEEEVSEDREGFSNAELENSKSVLIGEYFKEQLRSTMCKN
ncbi:hypothetical protein Hanom_Chr13g01223071 [Helianthus anomalus]